MQKRSSIGAKYKSYYNEIFYNAEEPIHHGQALLSKELTFN